MSNIIVRDAKVSDAPRLLEIYSYYVEQTAVSFEIETPSLSEFEHRISEKQARYAYLVIEEDGTVVGYSYAGTFIARAAYDHSCELTIYLDRTCKGKGYGRMLYEALFPKLRNRGIRNLYACIADPVGEEDEYLTRDSEHFHEHMGFVKVGTFHECGRKFGRYYNMIWMERLVPED